MIEEFLNVSRLCKQYGIELNCFVILGLPGDTAEDVKKTIELCERHGRVRPTIYTPYNLLTESSSLQDVMMCNRQIFVDGIVSPSDERAYYELFYDWVYKPTEVMENIS